MPSGLSEFAEVAVPVAVHGTFTYAIPLELRDAVRLGSRVEVPFGAKRNTGFVVALSDTAPEGSKIKPIRAVLDDDEPALLPEIIELCRWAAEYYIAPLGEMLRVAWPATMSARGKREVVVSGEAVPLAKALKVLTRTSIDRLRDAGVLVVRDQLRDAAGVRYDRFAILESDRGALPPKQRDLVELLRSRGGELSVK